MFARTIGFAALGIVLTVVWGAILFTPERAPAGESSPSAADADRQNQIVCAPRAQITAVLKQTHAETLRSAGVSARQLLVEVYVSEKGTWTIIATSAGGTACVIAVGNQWLDARPHTPGRDS